MSNKDLLKQAIAEAKTIREAAIANAKEALEETLTPHLKEMLAQKLQEMEEDEDKMEETINGAEAQDFSENPSKKGNLEEAEEEADEEEAPEEGEEEVEEEEVEIEDMSVEDLKDLIRDIVAQEVGEEEEAEMEAGEEGPEGQEDMVSMDGDSEEIDINELLAELEGMDKEEVKEEVLNESLMGQVVDLLGVTNSQAQMILGVIGAMGLVGASAVMAKVHDLALKGTFGEKAKAKAQSLAKAGSMAGSVTQQKSFKADSQERGNDDNEELNEALQAVKILRNQLQEVNLLNAKLLYVNKVFKANNLSEGQKVNVIAAFDKAETVKEVKLVFETVSKNVVAKPAAIKEHRSFASKATGNAQTTAPKEIISEVSEQVARWQKLAGIIKS